jgi:mannitol-specific phosphotransferase system IIBC component
MATNDNGAEPITANALNLTRVTGTGAVIATAGTALAGALDAFKGVPIAITIAVIAAVCVALVVAGLVVIADMRVRSQVTMHENQLKYLRGREHEPESPRNGQGQVAPRRGEAGFLPFRVGILSGE